VTDITRGCVTNVMFKRGRPQNRCCTSFIKNSYLSPWTDIKGDRKRTEKRSSIDVE